MCPKYVQILWVCSRACATLWAAVCTRSDRRMQTWPGMRQGMRRGIYELWLNCALSYARRLCATFPSPLAVEGMRRRYAPDGIRSNKVPFSMPTAFCNWLGMRQGMRRPFSTEGLGFANFCLSVSPKNRFNRTVCPPWRMPILMLQMLILMSFAVPSLPKRAANKTKKGGYVPRYVVVGLPHVGINVCIC